MKDFTEWMIDTGKGRQLQELASNVQNYTKTPVSGSMGTAMNMFDKRADKVGGRNKIKGIVQLVRKYASTLPPHIRKALGRELIGGVEDVAVGNQALNPKARFSNEG